MSQSNSNLRRPTEEEVVQAHGGLTDEGSRWVGPCPSCGGEDRFSFDKKTKLIQCRGCKPGKDTASGRAAYFAILVALGLTGLRADAGAPAPAATTHAASSDKDAERMRKAAYLYGLGIPIPRTPGQAHLDTRGVGGDWPGIRYLANARHGELAGRHRCILAPVVNTRSGDLIGVQRYFFDLQVKSQRKRSSGAPMGGGVLVAGSLASESIVVVEGLVNAMSIIKCGVVGGVWAAGGKEFLSGFQLPENVKDLVIGADRDEAGIIEAQKLAQRIKNLGINVRITAPPQGMGDWNDLLVANRSRFIRYAFRTNLKDKKM